MPDKLGGDGEVLEDGSQYEWVDDGNDEEHFEVGHCSLREVACDAHIEGHEDHVEPKDVFEVSD